MTDPQLLDTEPGGESTQYESIQTVTKPHGKQEGQLSGDISNTTTDARDTAEGQAEHLEKGERKAENIRFGESISEHGFGGETTTSSGTSTNDDAYGRAQAEGIANKAEDARKEQGYGAGSGVGG